MVCYRQRTSFFLCVAFQCSHVNLVNRLASSKHMDAALDYLRKVSANCWMSNTYMYRGADLKSTVSGRSTSWGQSEEGKLNPIVPIFNFFLKTHVYLYFFAVHLQVFENAWYCNETARNFQCTWHILSDVTCRSKLWIYLRVLRTTAHHIR